MATTYEVVAYGGAYYGQIPYAAVPTESIAPGVSLSASYAPNIDLKGRTA